MDPMRISSNIKFAIMAQASVSNRIIQNIGVAFGSAILGTVVNCIGRKAATACMITGAYHAGFITSLVFMVIGILPALFLTNKLGKRTTI